MRPGNMRLTVVVSTLLACMAGRTAPLAAPVVVPFEERNGLALVKVEVNGHPTVLILDTGSGAMVLDSTFATIAGVAFKSAVSRWSRTNRRVRQYGCHMSLPAAPPPMPACWPATSSCKWTEGQSRQ